MKPYFSRSVSTPLLSGPNYPPDKGSFASEEKGNSPLQKIETGYALEKKIPRAGSVSRSISLPFLPQSRPLPVRTPIARVSIPPAFAGL